MQRRELLATLGVAVSAGCLRLQSGATTTTATTETATVTPTARPTDTEVVDTTTPTPSEPTDTPSPTATVALEGQAVSYGLTLAEFEAEFERRTNADQRLAFADGYAVGGEPRFLTVWTDSGGEEWVARWGMTADQFQARFDEHEAEGLSPAHVSGYGVNGEARYLAIWDPEPQAQWVTRFGLTFDGYQEAFDTYTGDGYHLTHVAGYGVGGQDMYAGTWVDTTAPEWYAYHGLDPDGYESAYAERTGSGYRLVHISGYTVGDARLYATIWEKPDDREWVAERDLSASELSDLLTEYDRQGLRLASLSGYGVSGLARYAALWTAG